MTRPDRSELLVPGGSLAKLKLAVSYGADAIYIGTPDMSLRTKSAFSLEDIVEGVEYAHKFGKKVYLTLNLFSHNKDIEKLPKFIENIKKVKPDGVIIADPGIFNYVKEHAPDLELHISTQANVCSHLSVKFWEDQGAKLCVLAREVSFAELQEIREKCPNIKLETFIHGSMCMTYSGRCLLSNFMSERGANQGNCSHSCRWNYKLRIRLKDGKEKDLEINEQNADLFEFLLEEECRPGDFMPFEEDVRGSYILNSKDLCLMPKLDDYLALGIDSLKIEGRNKSLYYLAIVTRTYRQAMDAWYKDPKGWDSKKYLQELDTISNRGYSLAFHEGRLTNLGHNYDSTKSTTHYEFCGIILDHHADGFIIEVKNRVEAGDVFEFVPPAEKIILLRIYEFIMYSKENDSETKITDHVNPGFKPLIKIPYKLFDQENESKIKELLPINTVIRKERSITKTEFERLKLDKEAQKIELGKGSEKKYQEKKENLLKQLSLSQTELTTKSPRLGKEGCCAKGCNGCLIFWHDQDYAKARELLKTKKMGEML